MTPETNEHLDKAREYLVSAQSARRMQYNDEAGRAAYLAAFPRRAQALISGVHRQDGHYP